MYEEIVLITLLAFTIIGLYGAGSLINRRKSNKYLQIAWRQLKKLGVSGEYRELGSSGFIITLTDIGDNIKRVDVSLVLEKREFPLNWLIDRLRGKRDTVTISIIYNNQIYNREIDIFRLGNYYGDTLLKYRGEASSINEEMYIYPSDIVIDSKIKKMIKIVTEYKDIYLVSIKGGKKILTVIFGTRHIDDIHGLMKRLLGI